MEECIKSALKITFALLIFSHRTIKRRELLILEISKDRKGVTTEDEEEMIERWK